MKWYYKILIFRNKFITPYVQILLLFSKVASCFMSLYGSTVFGIIRQLLIGNWKNNMP